MGLSGSFISSIMIGHTNESGAFAVMFAGAFVADNGGAGAGIRGAGAPKPVKVSASVVLIRWSFGHRTKSSPHVSPEAEHCHERPLRGDCSKECV